MTDPLAPLVTLVALLAQACLLWLALLALLSVGARLPGALGRTARRAGRRVAPVALHAALGLAVVGGAGPALAADLPTPAGSTAEWPGVAPVTAPAAPSPRATAPDARVRVRPGDSLWSIAAAALGSAASPSRVAASWPRWWAANRSVVGDDPDLIHPGTVLDRPDDLEAP